MEEETKWKKLTWSELARFGNQQRAIVGNMFVSQILKVKF